MLNSQDVSISDVRKDKGIRKNKNLLRVVQDEFDSTPQLRTQYSTEFAGTRAKRGVNFYSRTYKKGGYDTDNQVSQTDRAKNEIKFGSTHESGFTISNNDLTQHEAMRSTSQGNLGGPKWAK